MSDPSVDFVPSRRASVALVAIIAVAWALAFALHRGGHTQGDDFALYLRQAQAIFDGNIGGVLADNRFTVQNSTGTFSPLAYPWGLPLLLSPFVWLWGLDYERLKTIEVAAFCVWLVLVHGIVRRRLGPWMAVGVVAVVGTAPALLAHTDQLLSEYPHAAAVAVFVWWMDRLHQRGTLLSASIRELAILGGLLTVAFNIRRESALLVIAIGMIQLVQVAPLLNDAARRRTPVGSIPWRQLVAPHASFAVSVAVFQLLLPSMLVPDNGGGRQFIGDRLRDYTSTLPEQLGVGDRPGIGAVLLILMAVGIGLGVRARPKLDGSLAAVAVMSMLAVSTHFRMVDRYYLQLLPWVIYFVVVAIYESIRLSAGWLQLHLARRWALLAAAVPLMFMVAVHAAVLPGNIDKVRTFNEKGSPQVGPTHPTTLAITQAVRRYTHPDDIIAYFRARTMTLLTDRRSIQSGQIDRILVVADYFAQRRNSSYYQPNLSAEDAEVLGLTEVWSDEHWVLWKVEDR